MHGAVVLAAYYRAIGAQDELPLAVAYPVRAASQVQVVLHPLAGLIEERICVVDLARDRDSCRHARHNEAVPIL